MYRMTVIHEDREHQWRIVRGSFGINIDCVRIDGDEDEKTFNVFLPPGAEEPLFDYLR